MRDELLNLMPDDLLNLIWVNIKPSVKYSLNKKYFNRYYFYRFGYINNKVLFRYKNISMYECYFINNLNYIKYLIRNDIKFVLDNIINFKFKYDNTNYIKTKKIVFENIRFLNFIDLCLFYSLKYNSENIRLFITDIINERGVLINKEYRICNKKSRRQNFKNKRNVWIA